MIFNFCNANKHNSKNVSYMTAQDFIWIKNKIAVWDFFFFIWIVFSHKWPYIIIITKAMILFAFHQQQHCGTLLSLSETISQRHIKKRISDDWLLAFSFTFSSGHSHGQIHCRCWSTWAEKSFLSIPQWEQRVRQCVHWRRMWKLAGTISYSLTVHHRLWSTGETNSKLQ